MNCPNCGKENIEGAFCTSCGSQLPVAEQQAPASAPTYAAPPQPQPQPVQYPSFVTPEQLPPQYRPLSAWAYFGLQLLFAIPVVGFVFLIVFSFSSGNINRRSFARSYWCGLLITVIIIAVLYFVFGATALAAFSEMRF